jgi:hypothetical protein
LEIRELWARPVDPETLGFCGAAQVALIRRCFTNVTTGVQSEETIPAVTSIPPVADPKQNAEQLLRIVRGHWTIETSNHYVRDRTYDEDRCQVRDANSAHILATLRSLARFLAKKGWHHPQTEHKKTTPAFNRFCQAHRTQALRWLITE